MPQELRTDADGQHVTISCLVSDLVFAWQLEPLPGDDGTRIAVHVEIPEEEAHRLDDQRAAISRIAARAGRAGYGRDLQHEVERRLGRAPHAREAALVEHLGQALLAGLGAERQPDVLAERRRRAEHRRARVEHAPDRVEVVLDACPPPSARRPATSRRRPAASARDAPRRPDRPCRAARRTRRRGRTGRRRSPWRRPPRTSRDRSTCARSAARRAASIEPSW